MHWELSDEQEMFSKSLREWTAAKYGTATVRQLQSDGDAATFTASLVEEGWWGVGYSEESGGQGGGVLELALASREFGRSAVPSSAWLGAAIAAPLLTEEELSQQLSGEVTFAVAVRADRVPNWTPAPGPVAHVLGAAEADVFLVPTSSGNDGRVGFARINASAATLHADDLLDRSRSTSAVEFSTDAAAAASVVDTDPSAAQRASNIAAVLVAADALGCAEKMLELSVQYSLQRKQFGQLIGSFQAVKHAAAQMLVTVEASYSTALYAGAAIDTGLIDASAVAAVAKAQVTGSVADVADTALTVHGAIGYTWEHDLQLFYKRAKLDRTLFGSPPVWNELIATWLLDGS
ncbi:acyl-CoA/acyl-ACP dehydrogenase [Rhodococcoides fascians A25f]|uniref:acyl-CoA dehydrogenase family protein n=1 Tax=Rhodococcoides fascians TaxID=1828 RepID=UPI00055A4D02|nr:acyl-CoA dehydrogenase family protein [Rhodococcus fascians]QII07843.1 acyl-CoA/acyl-ACP dehydrogenase [Rhodococcus fascians A25f]